jgi:hypothetical protein
MVTWEQEGVRIVVLVGNGASGPATVEVAATWKSSLDIEALAVVADPTFSLVPQGETGLPSQAIVDPRSMRVVHRRTGFDDDYSALELLLAQNKSL